MSNAYIELTGEYDVIKDIDIDQPAACSEQNMFIGGKENQQLSCDTWWNRMRNVFTTVPFRIHGTYLPLSQDHHT